VTAPTPEQLDLAQRLADELVGTVTVRAAEIVTRRAREEQLDLDDDAHLYIEVGIAAGIAATLIELRDRGAFDAWRLS
jgi:hypothetical protein